MQYTNRPSELYIEFADSVRTGAESTRTIHGWPVLAADHTAGSYRTLLADDPLSLPADKKRTLSHAAGEVLREYLAGAERILVCGLGNDRIAADRLGPAVCSRLGLCGRLPGGRCLYSFVPGVTALTGIPTDSLVRMAARTVCADRLLVIDALCAASATNLLRLLQCTDTGLTPGSGASDAHTDVSGKAHPLPPADTAGTPDKCRTNPEDNVDDEEYPPEISARTMPCPVVTAGIPTVIRTSLPCGDGTARSRQKYLVTPGAIDRAVECWASVLSAAIIHAVLP